MAEIGAPPPQQRQGLSAEVDAPAEVCSSAEAMARPPAEADHPAEAEGGAPTEAERLIRDRALQKRRTVPAEAGRPDRFGDHSRSRAP